MVTVAGYMTIVSNGDLRDLLGEPQRQEMTHSVGDELVKTYFVAFQVGLAGCSHWCCWLPF